MGQTLKLVSSDPDGAVFESVETTRNVSPEGVYFITERECYEEGVRLFVTLPYHSGTDPRNRDYVGQVIRVEKLENGQRGVAIQLLSSMATNPPTNLPGTKLH
jgi:hypothetical protein